MSRVKLGYVDRAPSARVVERMASLMEDLPWIAAKMGYCAEPRGFEKECEELYRRLGQAIDRVNALRDSCFV